MGECSLLGAARDLRWQGSFAPRLFRLSSQTCHLSRCTTLTEQSLFTPCSKERKAGPLFDSHIRTFRLQVQSNECEGKSTQTTTGSEVMCHASIFLLNRISSHVSRMAVPTYVYRTTVRTDVSHGWSERRVSHCLSLWSFTAKRHTLDWRGAAHGQSFPDRSSSRKRAVCFSR